MVLVAEGGHFSYSSYAVSPDGGKLAVAVESMGSSDPYMTMAIPVDGREQATKLGLMSQTVESSSMDRNIRMEEQRDMDHDLMMLDVVRGTLFKNFLLEFFCLRNKKSLHAFLIERHEHFRKISYRCRLF